jgi:hypothetical protein
MKKLNNEGLNVTSDQLSRDASLKNYLKSPDGKKTDVNIVDKNKSLNSASATNTSPTTTTLEEDDVIGTPQVLKYLSKMIDESGSASKPFSINGKTYQMVRAMDPNRNRVPAVQCLDTPQLLYSVDDFDRQIATPARDAEMAVTEEQPIQNDNTKAIDYLNVDDLNGSRHFFVNKKTGEVVAKFPNTSEMIKSGISLSEDEDYMDAKTLKRHRLRRMLDSNDQDLEEDVNLGKLQQDVKRLSKLIKDKFVIALDKINTPIEQSQFLVAMANEIGVPFTKLASIISSFKDISKDQETSGDSSMTTDSSVSNQGLAERRIITKNELLESIKPVSNKIKIKDIKNGRL